MISIQWTFNWFVIILTWLSFVEWICDFSKIVISYRTQKGTALCRWFWHFAGKIICHEGLGKTWNSFAHTTIFSKHEKISNQRQFNCFSFVSLIDFVFMSLFLFCMGINFECKTSPKTTQLKTQSVNLFNVFSWKQDEKEKSFQNKKNDLKKIQYVIQKMENVMNDNKLQRKKFDFRCEFLKGFLILKKQLMRKKNKTIQFKCILFNCVLLWMCLKEYKYI